MNVQALASNYNFYQDNGMLDTKRVEEYISTSSFSEIKALFDNGILKKDRLGIAQENGDIIYFNMASTGNRELTKEQEAYLRETYNMGNLTQQEYIKMLADLSNFGVVSGAAAHGEARRMLTGGESDSAGSFSRSIEDWIEYFLARLGEQEDDLGKLRASNADLKIVSGVESVADFHAKMQRIISSVYA